MTPVVPLRPPEHLVGRREHAPVRPADRGEAGLELRRRTLFEDGPHFARRGVGDAEPRLLVVARRRHERHMRRVGIPLHVEERAAIGHVVADRRAVLVRRHPQPHHARGFDLDHDAMDTEDHAVFRQRVPPLLELRCADLRAHEIHPAHAAAVMLEGRDLPGVRRPQQHRAVTPRPAGVVGRIAEILDAVGRERAVLVGRQIPHPQVVVPDVRRVPAIR